MRWEDLFADLSAEFAASGELAYDSEIAETERAAYAGLRLADRLAASAGASLVLDVRGAGRVSGTLLGAAPEWSLLDDNGTECLIATSAVTTIDGVPDLVAPHDVVAKRMTLAFALRGFARRRMPVALVLTDGTRLAGTLDGVGADFADLAVHPIDEPRRRTDPVRTVRLRAVALLRAR